MNALSPTLGFARLKQDIITRTGHFYYADKDALLWERLSRRLAATGAPDAESYRALLDDPGRGEAEWAELEAEITIGETFFFRYAEQFAALRDTILPAIIEAKRAERRIRIWSAGCATGAEPYSVAILLRHLLRTEMETWRVSILGTDINATFLQAARQAEFGEWALRAVPADQRAEDFVRSPDGKRWVLRPQHRALVRFERHNLRTLLDGTSPLNLTDFDLILCRNVLIYFHPDTAQAIVRALGERLTPDGWLLLGHAEPNPAFTRFLHLVDLPGTAAYRRLEGSPPPPAPPPSAQPAMPPAWQPAPLPEAPRTPAATPPAQAAPEVPPARADLLEEVRAAADRGEPERAAALCRAALAADPMQPALHFYAGLLAWTLGDTAEAERAFRRAIYLRPDYVMAHYQLGLLRLHRGEGEAGRRAIGNALGIARGLPPASPLNEGDGLTAGTFRDLARLHLALQRG